MGFLNELDLAENVKIFRNPICCHTSYLAYDVNSVGGVILNLFL